MKLLNAETFDTTSFDSDAYNVVVWYTDSTVNDKYIVNSAQVKDKELNLYGINVSNEDSQCLLDYYGYDMSKGYYYVLYDGNKVVLETNDKDKVIKYLSE